MSNSFDNIAVDLFNERKAKLLTTIDVHSFPLNFLNEQIRIIDFELSTLHNSNIKFTEIYLSAAEKKIENKNLSIPDLCEKYCHENGIEMEAAKRFFPVVNSLYKTKHWAQDKMPELAEYEKDKKLEQSEIDSEDEYTLTRRLIAFEIMLREVGLNSQFGKLGFNKTDIAQFIDFLIHKETKYRLVRDTPVHTRLKRIWGNLESNKISDLEYVKKKFEEIELDNLAKKLEEVISKKKSKEI